MCTSSSAVAKRPRGASCLSVVSFVASVVQYLERSFFISSYFSFGFTSAYNSILFYCLRRNVNPCSHTHDRSWLCVLRERPWSLSRWRTTATVTLSRVALGGRIPAVYDQRYNCHNLVAVVHRRPRLQHLACCSVNSRQIGSESRFLPIPPAFDAPVRGVAVGISPSRLVRKN